METSEGVNNYSADSANSHDSTQKRLSQGSMDWPGKSEIPTNKRTSLLRSKEAYMKSDVYSTQIHTTKIHINRYLTI